MAGDGGNKKRFQYCTDPSGQEILYLRALQGQSGRNPIDLTLQDNVLIPNDFFEYIYHIGCAISLHTITNSGLTPGGQNLSSRQTVFFLPVDPMDKNHKDPDTIDLEAPRLAQHMHKAWKKHQNAVNWVGIKLAQKKGLKFYQTRSNTIIFHETLPAYCIPKAIMMGTAEIIYEKVYASPRPPPNISFKDNWTNELGSEVAGGGKDSQQTQPKTKNPIVKTSTALESLGKTRYESQPLLSSWNEQHQRTGRPVLDAYSSSYSEWNVDKNWSSQEWKSDELMEVRTGRLVYEQQPGLFTHTDRFIVDDDDMDSDTVAELDMSLKIQIILTQGE